MSACVCVRMYVTDLSGRNRYIFKETVVYFSLASNYQKNESLEIRFFSRNLLLEEEMTEALVASRRGICILEKGL